MGYVEGLDREVQTLKRFVPFQPEDSEMPSSMRMLRLLIESMKWMKL
jgi:hypothetical protein